MEQFFYTETMTVMNADADFRSLLKPSALLRYVEQISTDHARAFGMDDQFFKDRGVTFLVGKQALKFDRVPQRAETLTLTSRAQVSKHGSGLDGKDEKLVRNLLSVWKNTKNNSKSNSHRTQAIAC